MNANERADAIIQDILTNHLPRVVEALKAGYVDENQVLVIYDHAVRARILKEFAEAQPVLEHVDNLTKINRELEAEWRAEMAAKAKVPPFERPGEKAQDEAATHGTKPPYLYEDAVRDAKKAEGTCCPPGHPGVKGPPGIPEAKLSSGTMAIIVGRNTLTGVQSFVACMDGGLPSHTLDRGCAWVQRMDDAKALATEWTHRYADMAFSIEVVAPDTKSANAVSQTFEFSLNGKPKVTVHRLMTGNELKMLLPEGQRGCSIFEFAPNGLTGVGVPDTMPVSVDGGIFYSRYDVSYKSEFKFILDKEPRTIQVPTVTGAFIKAMLPEAKRKYALFQEASGNDPDIVIHDDSTVNVDGLNLYSVPPATFGMPKKLTCVCGGEINELPTSIETLLQCVGCKRIYVGEHEIAHVKQTETKVGQKCPDAVYYTTGTLANGTDPIPMETEINLNGQKTKVKAKDGKFILSYEQIVRMTINQDRDPLNQFTGSDDELPMLSCVFHHRVPFQQLKYERDGSLWACCSVECTPGMSITCVSTSNA